MNSDKSDRNIYEFHAFLGCLPALRSLRFGYLGDRWREIIATLSSYKGSLQVLEIEHCDIKPGELTELFRHRGLSSQLPIDHLILRRCQTIPLELRPHLQRLCRKVEWESYWEWDETEGWPQYEDFFEYVSH